MATTTSISSINTELVVQQLVSSWKDRYITPIETRKTNSTNELDALTSLNTTVSTLHSKFSPLLSGTSFWAKTSSSSNTGVLTAAADSTAPSGTYNIQVTQLAQQHKITSGQYTGAGLDIVTAEGAGAKQFNLTINGTVTAINVTVNAGDTNQTILQNIATTINSSGAAATAIVVNETGTSSKLVLTSNNSGVANSLTLTDVAGTLTATTDTVAAGVNKHELQAPLDSQFTIDTLNFQRSSNTISDALTGVTMQLKSLGTSTLSVQADSDAITTSIQDFIDSYNAVLDELATDTAYNVDTKEGGVLLHTPVARTMASQLRPLIGLPVAGLPAAFESLSSIGIDTDKTGKLSIADSTKLQNSLLTNMSDVEKIFNDPTDGVITRLNNYVDTITTFSTGALSSAIDGVNTQLTSLQSWIDQRTTEMDGYEAQLRVRYGALDALLTTNQNIITALSGFSLIPKTT